jgi:TfoX N-terminal domain
LLGGRDNSPVPFDERLAERFRELTANHNGIREMSMIGGRAFVLNGNMAVGASGEGGLIVRVDPSETARLLRSPHAAPFIARVRWIAGSEWAEMECGRSVSSSAG